MSSNAAFFAIWTEDLTVSDNQIIKFDHVRTNIGQRYDCSTGRFSAPFPGCFVFNVSLVTKPDKRIEVSLEKNGEEWMKMYAGSSQFNGSGANTTILQLVKGDEVYIKVNEIYHSDGTLLDGSNFSSFSGFLQK